MGLVQATDRMRSVRLATSERNVIETCLHLRDIWLKRRFVRPRAPTIIGV